MPKGSKASGQDSQTAKSTNCSAMKGKSAQAATTPIPTRGGLRALSRSAISMGVAQTMPTRIPKSVGSTALRCYLVPYIRSLASPRPGRQLVLNKRMVNNVQTALVVGRHDAPITMCNTISAILALETSRRCASLHRQYFPLVQSEQKDPRQCATGPNRCM